MQEVRDPLQKRSTASLAYVQRLRDRREHHRRVLPTPPGPVNVSSRTSSRRSRSHRVASSRSRPTSEVSGVGRFVNPAGEVALDIDGPLHRGGDLGDGGNSGGRLVSCQRGELAVARRELPLVVPQPDIVPFVIKRVNEESLPVEDNDNGATAVTPSSQVMNGRKRRGSLTRDRCCRLAARPLLVSRAAAALEA